LTINLDSLKKCYELAKGKNLFLTCLKTCEFLALVPDFPGKIEQIGLAYAFSKM
jgi:hypothetical protein